MVAQEDGRVLQAAAADGSGATVRLVVTSNYGEESGGAHRGTAGASVAALDVSIQADVLNLLKQIQSEMGLTFMFISHDLSVVAHTCDHVAVMYLGRIVESATTKDLFAQPRHPYTRALFSAIPSLDPDDRGKAQKLEGEIPSPTNQPPGCKFHTRCPYVIDICKSTEPKLEKSPGGHAVSCHRWEELLEDPAA